jgi:hypothetical protein
MVLVPSQEPLMQLVQYHWFSERRRSMETMLMLLQLPTPTTPPPPLELVDALFCIQPSEPFSAPSLAGMM